MNNVFDKLRALQDILSQKYSIEQEISDIPKALTKKTELVNRLKRAYIESNAKFEELKEKVRHLRIRLSDAETQRENFEKQMDLIKTQREYETLDKEIKDASEKEQQIRKEILREEKALDELKHKLENEEKLINIQEQELEQDKLRIKEQSDEKETLLEELKVQEAEIVPGVDEEILFKFERIIRSKAGLGIVSVNNSICSGCHMILPAQFENDVRTEENILFCPYCSRILFYEDTNVEPAEESDYFASDDSGGLADLLIDGEDFEDDLEADIEDFESLDSDSDE